MAETLEDGDRVEVQGSSSRYTLSRQGDATHSKNDQASTWMMWL